MDYMTTQQNGPEENSLFNKSRSLFHPEPSSESNVAFNVRKALECHAQDLEYQMEQIRTSFGRDVSQQPKHGNDDEDDDEYSYREEEEYLSQDERAIYHDLEDIMNSIRSRPTDVNDDNLGKLLWLVDKEETATASFSETSEDPSLSHFGEDFGLSSPPSPKQIIQLVASSPTSHKNTTPINDNSREPTFSDLNSRKVESSSSRSKYVDDFISKLPSHNQPSAPPPTATEEFEENRPRKHFTKEKEKYLEDRAVVSGQSNMDPDELSILEHLEFLLESLRNLSPEEFLKEFDDDVEGLTVKHHHHHQEGKPAEKKTAIIHHIIRLLRSKAQDMYNQGEGLNVVYASSLLAASIQGAPQNVWPSSMLPAWFRHNVLQASNAGEKPKWALLPTMGSASADGRHFMPLCDSEDYHEEDPLLSDLEDMDEV
eukprot:scaffold2519_cov168-Amphora_coffeaeformis.AAC.16